MKPPDLRPYFPHARVLREIGGDIALCDPEFGAGCGYITLAEAEILFHLAQAFPGRWCEIGSHTGWSAAHVAAAGNEVICVDPGFRSETMRHRAQENWMNAYDAKAIEWFPLVRAETSEAFFAKPQFPFHGFFIDGDHTAPEPLNDAKRAIAALSPKGVIVLHDSRGQPIADAIEWLSSQGLKVRTWDTMNGIAACWRGAPDLVLP